MKSRVAKFVSGRTGIFTLVHLSLIAYSQISLQQHQVPWFHFNMTVLSKLFLYPVHLYTRSIDSEMGLLCVLLYRELLSKKI